MAFLRILGHVTMIDYALEECTIPGFLQRRACHQGAIPKLVAHAQIS